MEESGIYEADENLLQRFIEGDNNALSVIYNRYVDMLYAYGTSFKVSKEIVEDNIQDLFCYLHFHRKQLSSITNLKYYLLRAIRNKLLNYYNSKSFFHSSIEKEMPDFVLKITVEDTLIEYEEQQLLKEKIKQLLACLSSNQKEALYLHYIEEMEYKEVASLLNCTEENARKLVSRAIEKIKKNEGIVKITLLLFFHATEKGITYL